MANVAVSLRAGGFSTDRLRREDCPRLFNRMMAEPATRRSLGARVMGCAIGNGCDQAGACFSAVCGLVSGDLPEPHRLPGRVITAAACGDGASA